MHWPELSLGIGTGRLCSLNGGVTVCRAAWFLDQAFDMGIRFIDTAPTYGQGHVEEAIGRLAPQVRNQYLVCSKVGYTFGRKADLINFAKPVLRPILPWANFLRHRIAAARQEANSATSCRLNIEPNVIRSILEKSLQRIRRDYLDLLLLHDPSGESVDNPANQIELSQLVKSGKIRSWGVSTCNADVVRRAIDTAGCAAVQFPVHRQWIDENPGLIQQCGDRGVSIIANSVICDSATGGTHGAFRYSKSASLSSER
jgi:aryl-alcohol dehydrogenase-like predicted oxidoreductase